MATPNPTAAVNPSAESLDRLAAAPDHDAIAMLNLLQYSPGDGPDRYRRYAAVATRTIAARGGSLLYVGNVIDGAAPWNTAAIVRYPRRAAFIDMQADPTYLAAIPDRVAGLAARMLYPFHLPDAADTEVAGVAVVAIELIRGSADRDERVICRLAADGPGLVTDEPWDELRLVGYASIDDWRSRPSVHDRWSLPTQPGSGTR